MSNKALIYILFVSLMGMIIGLILWSFQLYSYKFLLDASQSMFLLTGTYFLLKNGSFIKTKESKLLGVGVAILIVGVMFKLMHWPGASILLIGGFISTFLIYLLHFLRKPQKDLVDFGKVIFIGTFLTGRCFILMHWPKGHEISFLSIVILILLVIYVVQLKGIVKTVK